MADEKKTENAFLFILIPFMIITVIVLVYTFTRTPAEPEARKSSKLAFDRRYVAPAQTPSATPPAPVEPPAETIIYEDQRTESMQPIAGGLFDGSPAESGSGPAAASGRAAETREDLTDRQHEIEFMRKNGRAFKRYEAYLSDLGRKYKAKYPAIREMDADFAKMDRYMALNRQYAKDRDAYKWVRGVAALPEVRKKIMSYAGNPAVLGPMIQVCMEALKNPPPSAIQAEAMRVLTSDKEVAPYVNSVSAGAMSSLTMALPSSIPPGTDITPLKNYAAQMLTPQQSSAPRSGY